MKNLEAKISYLIPLKRIDAIGSGIPFEEIYSTLFSKTFIFNGMSDINYIYNDHIT